MRKLLINISMLLFLAVSGQGTTYYVSTTGSDAASGLSVDSAWQSIDNGDVTAVLLPGDTVNVLSGTYALTTPAVFNLSGTTGNPIVYIGYGPGDVVFDAGGNNIAIFDIAGDHTWFEALVLSNSGDNGLEISGSNNSIMNCVVSRVDQYGIYLASGADSSKIYNNTLYAVASIGVYSVSAVKTTRIINNIIDSTITGIWAASGNVAAHNNIWRAGDTYFGGITDSAGGISADPLFADVAINGFALQPGSPCIDSGMDLGRPYNGTAPDMGALETESGTVYWVSTTGDDSNDGLDSTTAWASIDNGDTKGLLGPGDTVNIMPGQYDPTSDYQLTIGGSAGSPVTYRKFGDGTVLVDGSLSSEHIFDIIVDYVDIEGLEIRNGSTVGIRITSNNCIVRDCYIHNIDEEGIASVGNDNLFEKNVVTYTGKDGITIDAENNLTYHNTVFYPGDYGIHYKAGVTDGRVFNNIVVGATEGVRGKGTVIAGFNSLWLNTSDYANGITDSAGGILLDPLFVDTAAGDFNLRVASPARDAGLNLGYPFLGTAPDMGALEATPQVPTNYYVSTTGDNGNSGLDTANAWSSIDNGDTKGLLGPGDTINILSGTYSITATISLTISGTESLPIVYRKWGEGEAVVDLGGVVDDVFQIDASHTHIKDLTATNAGRDGFGVAGDSCMITGCVVYGVTLQGIDVEGSNNLILRNLIYNTGESGLVNRAGGETNRYYNNTFYSCPLDGIWIDMSVTTARVFNNIIVSAGDAIEGVSGNICGFNDIWSSTSNDYIGGVSDSAGGISANPMFNNSSGKDFSLKIISPAIDTGLDLGYPFLGSAPDMGALEYESNTSPVITVPGTVAATEGIGVSFQATAADDFDIPALTSSTLPTGAAFTDNGDGTGDFDWTPDFLQSGSYDVTFYATDDSLAVDSAVVTITVAEAGNQSPVLSTISDTTTTEWVNLTFGVSATDIESVPNLMTSTLPSGAGFVDNGDGTGNFNWTPSFPQAGTYPITFYAADDSLAVDSAVVTITVDSATISYIVVAPDTVTVSTDSTVNFTVSGFNAAAQQAGHGDITWSLTTPLGDIDTAGLFEPHTPGTTQAVAVSSLGLTDTSGTITVVPGTLATLTVAPDSVQITTDSAHSFSVSGVDADSNPADIGTISWSLTDSIGTIDSTGVFTPTAAGTTRVVALSSWGGVTDTSQILIVNPGEIVRIEVSPQADTLVHGDSVQFIATGFDAVGSPTPTGPIDWSVMGNIGTIDTAGWLRATGSGIGYVVPTSSLYGIADTSGVVSVEAFTVQIVPLGNNSLRPGDTAHAILAFTMSNGLSYDLEIEGVTLRDASTGSGSLAERLSNLDSVAIYRDIDGDAAITAADARLARTMMSADTAHLDFAPVTIQAASSETFIVTVDASLYPRDGDSLDIYLLSGTDIHTVGDSTVVVGVDSINSSGYTLIDGLVSGQLSFTTTGVSTLTPTDSAHHVLTVDLPRNGYRPDTLNTLSVTNQGSADNYDIDSLILYRDNNTGAWEGADEELRVSRLWYTGSQWTGSGLSEILTDQTTRFYVGAYLAAYPANGATLSLTIPQNGLGMSSQNDGPLDAAPEAIDTITIVTSEAVVLEPVAIPSLSLVPGEASLPLTGFNLTNSYGTPVGIDSLRLTLYAGNDAGASQAQLDSQIDSVLLYLNRDDDHTETTVLDTLLASAQVVDGEAVFSTAGLELTGGGGYKEL